MIKQLLGILVAGALLGGCVSSKHPAGETGPIAVGSFVQKWQVPLQLSHGNSLTDLYVRDDMLYAYTAQRIVYAIACAGGELRWSRHVARPTDQLRPPVLIKGMTVIPVIDTLVVIDGHGREVRNVAVGHSIRSPLTGSGNFVYCGLDFPNGARLAKIDMTRPYGTTRWELLTGAGVSSAPVLYQGALYAGAEDGKVYALNEGREPVWPLAGGVFATDGKILADLKADDFGIYVASMDTKLYCLDRGSGKVKWMYYAGVSLTSSPTATADNVYQFVPGRGVIAIDKTSGDYIRKPRWTVQAATAFLAEDDQFAFMRLGDNSILGVDKKTGEPKVRSHRTDLTAFATNPQDGTIYVASSAGEVMAGKAVSRPGTVGQVVLNEIEFESVAMAR